MDDATYYKQLELGARYLASRASSEVERLEHLGWANRYYRLGAGSNSPRSAVMLVPA